MSEVPEKVQKTNVLSTRNVVYHYTSIDTLQKIVEARSLWATSVKYLNDVLEYRFFVDELAKRLEVFSEKHPEIRDYKPDFAHDINADFRKLAFVTSFTTQRDSLTHWRSYCSQGNGVCVGFRSECLNQAYASWPIPTLPGTVSIRARYARVAYLKANDHLRLDGLLEALYSEAERYLSTHPGLVEQGLTVLSEFSQYVSSQASLCKHNSFKGEREYRLIVDGIWHRQDLLKFRTVRSSLVPYVLLNIPGSEGRTNENATWDAIASVTIGPTPNMALTREALQAFFSIHALNNVLIKTSEVPYRDW